MVVIAVKDTTLLPVNTHGGVHLDNRKLNWVSLAGLNRITEHVAKVKFVRMICALQEITSVCFQGNDCLGKKLMKVEH